MRAFSLAELAIPEPNTGCWLWAGRSTTRFGYGSLSWAAPTRLAHRASYEAHFGPIPHGMCVCHRCDTPACVNPEHLFLGSKADNCRDMWAKGRGPVGDRNGVRRNPSIRRGERNGRAKLTHAKADELLARYRDGWSKKALMEAYLVSKATVNAVCRGDRWRNDVR